MPWESITTIIADPPHGKLPPNPYADWDSITRPLLEFEENTVRWSPAFIELKDEVGDYPYKRAAGKVIDWLIETASNPESADQPIAIDIISLLFLIRAGERRGDEDANRFHSFFLWRPTEKAYDHTDAFKVLHVGAESAALGKLEAASEDAVRALTELQDRIDESSAGKRDTKSARSTRSPSASEAAASATPVTAVIDDLIGFANERFRHSADDSRFEHLFIQSLERFAEGLGPFVAIGSILSREGINELISKYDEGLIYRTFDGKREAGARVRFNLDIDPRFLNLLLGDVPQIRAPRASHGTHIADLAAGAPLGTTDAPIIGVDLVRLATADTAGTRLDYYAMTAAMFLITLLDEVDTGLGPMVVNFSYALQAGPKNGSGFLESEMARLVEERQASGKPTWLVLPAGNAYRAMGRAILEGDTNEVEWIVQPGDQSPSYVEAWCDPSARSSLILTAPSGEWQSVSLHPSEASWRLTNDAGVDIARIYRRYFASIKEVRVVFAVAQTSNPGYPVQVAPAGSWKIALRAVGKNFQVRMDVQRDDTPGDFPQFGRQSYFDWPDVEKLDEETFVRNEPPAGSVITREGTLSSYATSKSKQVLVVGGAFEEDALTQPSSLGNDALPSLYTGSAPNEVRRYPALAAISELTRAHPGRLASGFGSGSATAISGTSTAAALVTRKVAAKLKDDPNISRADLLKHLIDAGQFPAPDARLGYGLLVELDDDEARPARRVRRAAVR